MPCRVFVILSSLGALAFHAGRAKCIYTDPPYNTRSVFERYDDNLKHGQ